MAKFAWMETHPKYPKSATLFNGPKNGEISWDCHTQSRTGQFPPEGCLSANSEKSKNATASCVILTTTSMGKIILLVAHLLRMNIALATKNNSVAHKECERQKCETCSVALEMRLNLIHDAVCPAAKEIRLATVPMVQPITWCRKNFVQHHLGNSTSLAKAILPNAIK